MKSRTEIEQAAATAAAALMERRAELAQARTAASEADAAYIETGVKRSLERKRDTADALERAEVLERRADEAYGSAHEALLALDREDRERELAAFETELAEFAALVERDAAAFVDVDRQIDTLAMNTAARAVAMQTKYDRAIALAMDLRAGGLERRIGPRPTLDNVALAVRRAISRARQNEGRDPLAPLWLAEAPDAHDWRLRGMSAEELRDASRVAQRARDEETRSAVAATAARDAAAQIVAIIAQTETKETA